MANTQRTTPTVRRRLTITPPHPAGTVVIPNFVDNSIRRLRTSFYAAGHLLPIDFADRLALLERRERILDLAEALLDLADAMDAPLMDREPEPVEAEDDEATRQPVTLAPDWLRTKKGRRGVKVRHRAPPQSSSKVCHLEVARSGTPVEARTEIVHAFRAPGEPLPIRPAEMPVPPPANCPPGFDSDGDPIEPKRRSGKDCHSPLATGLRNACLAGTGFWMLVGLAGWGLA